MKLIPLLCMLLLTANLVNAAAVQGTVYSLYLDILEGAVVQIDTEPKQIKVANDGTYQFGVKPGDYIIRAAYTNSEQFYYEENISIKDNEGVYTIDLILLPDVEDDDLENVDDLFADITKDRDESNNYIVYIALIVLIAIGLGFYLYKRSRPIKAEEIKTEAEEDLDKIIEFIKKHGGRTTQKEIRKEFPYSEAKISLIIAELEDKGIVKKIKKGRGNIIILQK